MAVGVYNPPTSGGTSVTTPTNPAGGGPEPSTILPGENGIGAATPVTSVGTTESANPTALPSEIASQPLIGGTAGVGSTGATPEKPYSEEQLVHELATYLGVKPTKNTTLEAGVVQALAKKFDVHITSSGMTTQGTGSGQGEVGQVRHAIATWFDDRSQSPVQATTKRNVSQAGALTPKEEAAYAAAEKIKDPKQRQKALDDLLKQAPTAASLTGGTPPTPASPSAAAPRPVASTNALDNMLQQVGKKLGVQAVGAGGIAAIAKAQGLPTGAPAQPGTPGQQQTAAENYVAFTKQAVDPKTGKLTTYGTQMATELETAGYLIFNDTETAQTVTPNQVASAYVAALTTAVQNKQSLPQTLQAGANAANVANPPQSETQSFVAGVAGEFGVYLTQQQINTIATKYQNVATSAGPNSVSDEIKQDVIQLYDPGNPNNPPGVANTMFQDIKQAALNYQIPISDQQIGSMVKSGLGTASVAYPASAATDVENKAVAQFQEQAAGLYPTLAAQIKAGNTVQNLTAPYFSVAQSLTGVPSSTMMTEQQGGGITKWGNFLQGGTDPKTGAPTTMTLDQWKKTLMQDPQYGFQKTQGAQNMAEQLSSAILNEFGRVTTQGSGNAPLASSYNPGSALSAGNPTAGS